MQTIKPLGLMVAMLSKGKDTTFFYSNKILFRIAHKRASVQALPLMMARR